jgi:hypothetical protein
MEFWGVPFQIRMSKKRRRMFVVDLKQGNTSILKHIAKFDAIFTEVFQIWD